MEGAVARQLGALQRPKRLLAINIWQGKPCKTLHGRRGTLSAPFDEATAIAFVSALFWIPAFVSYGVNLTITTVSVSVQSRSRSQSNTVTIKKESSRSRGRSSINPSFSAYHKRGRKYHFPFRKECTHFQFPHLKEVRSLTACTNI